MNSLLQEPETRRSLLNRHSQTLEFHNVSLNYGNLTALQSVNLTLGQGDILFVTGASGAGKSSLLNVMAGDIKPSQGKVVLPQNKNRKNFFVAQVFQDLKLLNHQTCLENMWVAYDSSIYNSRAEFEKDLTELSKILGVWEFRDLKIQDANGGLKQKVAMIRALLSKPNLILADEPTAALDRESSVKLFEVLNFYNVKKGLTIVWATHNRELIKQFPGKICHLDKGKLVYSGHACFI